MSLEASTERRISSSELFQSSAESSQGFPGARGSATTWAAASAMRLNVFLPAVPKSRGALNLNSSSFPDAQGSLMRTVNFSGAFMPYAFSLGTSIQRRDRHDFRAQSTSCNPFAPSSRFHLNGAPSHTWRMKSSHSTLNALSQGLPSGTSFQSAPKSGV